MRIRLTPLGSVPGYHRLFVFLSILFFGASVLTGAWLSVDTGRDFLDVLTGLSVLVMLAAVFSTSIAYVVAILLRCIVFLHRWVKAGYEPDDWGVVIGIFRASVVTTLLVVVALLYRYEIVTYETGRDRFYYLLWDRWTGAIEAKSANHPESPVFGRGKSG